MFYQEYFEDDQRYCQFRGLIATGRKYKSDRSGYLTFVTIGYDDGKYVDLVINRIVSISKMWVISGIGKIKTDGDCEWVEVLNCLSK